MNLAGKRENILSKLEKIVPKSSILNAVKKKHEWKQKRIYNNLVKSRRFPLRIRRKRF